MAYSHSDLRKQLLFKSKSFYAHIKKTPSMEGYGAYVLKFSKEASFGIAGGQSNYDFYANNKHLVHLPYNKVIDIKMQNVIATGISKDDMKDYFLSKNHAMWEMNFEKLRFDEQNMISKAFVKDYDFLISPKINYRAEDVINDKLSAKKQMILLYELSRKGKAFEEIAPNFLVLGEMGIKKRSLQTKDAISAFDSTIGDYLKQKVGDYESIKSPYLFSYQDKGNKFLIFLLPSQVFEFELIEYFPKKGYVFQDHEAHDTKVYEPNTAGGYYAARLAVLEFLDANNIKAKVVVLRVIDNYELPLGVVLVREFVRKAFENIRWNPTTQEFVFDNEHNKPLMLTSKQIKLIFEVEGISWEKSQILKRSFKQRSLFEFVKG